MPKTETAESLVAIIMAARRAGLRDLERVTRRHLWETHGMRVTIPRERLSSAARERQEGDHGA